MAAPAFLKNVIVAGTALTLPIEKAGAVLTTLKFFKESQRRTQAFSRIFCNNFVESETPLTIKIIRKSGASLLRGFDSLLPLQSLRN